jgi:hypothetical protein
VLYPERVALDSELLSLVVAGWQPDRACSDVARIAGYEATFSFADGLPDRVRAVEPAWGEKDARTAVVDCP